MSFLHSMAAGALNLARDIASLSLTRWEATWEYEDDYCFYRILHAIALNPSFISTAEAGALLAQFEHALEGQSSTRYDATRALCWRDHGAFVSALEGFLEEEQERLDEERSSSKVLEGDVCYWAHRNVSLEALALLKFAELLGMRIDESFPLCPAPARLPFQDESYLDLFVALESTP